MLSYISSGTTKSELDNTQEGLGDGDDVGVMVAVMDEVMDAVMDAVALVVGLIDAVPLVDNVMERVREAGVSYSITTRPGPSGAPTPSAQKGDAI